MRLSFERIEAASRAIDPVFLASRLMAAGLAMPSLLAEILVTLRGAAERSKSRGCVVAISTSPAILAVDSRAKREASMAPREWPARYHRVPRLAFMIALISVKSAVICASTQAQRIGRRMRWTGWPAAAMLLRSGA